MEGKKINMYPAVRWVLSSCRNDGRRVRVVSVTGKYLQARREIYGRERSDKPDEDRDFHCAGIRRKHRYGFGEDERKIFRKEKSSTV